MARVFSLNYQFRGKLACLVKMARVYIIEDDSMMAECLELAARQCLPNAKTHSRAEHVIKKFTNVFDAMPAINHNLPDLIILDILLSGPDGFSLLNELMTYHDTATIPIIIVSSLDLSTQDLSHYGVVCTFQKETMTPKQLSYAVKGALDRA